jgi:hypothetical protein
MSSALDVDLSAAVKWLRDCTRSHNLCQAKGAGWANKTPHLPTRVLDLLAVGGNITLYESLQEEEPYLCLSHCWGTGTQFTTTLGTLQERKSEIQWTDLPPLFQDAVIIARKLGYRYLWVDSLCIIQDDPTDWDREAARMWAIYQGAELTIAATDCPDSSHRILRDVDLRSSSPTTHKLLTRAWFFQERYLSRRVLHFRGKKSLWWECMQDSQRVGLFFANSFTRLPNNKNMIAKWRDLTRNEVCTSWHRLIAEYSGMNLTFAKDRLPAILGMATEFRCLWNAEYLAGLWTDTLIQDMLWRYIESPKRPRPARNAAKAPSWSWGSVDGRCVYSEDPVVPEATVLEVQPPNLTKLDADQRARGCITIRVKALSGRLRYGQDAESLASVEVRDKLLGFTADCPIWEPGDDFISPGAPLYVLRLVKGIYRNKDLVVRCVDEQGYLYERVGITSRFRNWVQFPTELHEQIIHLI